jgi:hypothetical protein
VEDDEQWVPVTCDSAFGRAQDGGSANGCSSNGRFIDNQDSTVTDTCTGLMWQKDTADYHADGQPNEQDYVFWSLSLDYCDNLSFAGYSDWRLPNVRELESLVDYGRSQPSIDPIFTALNAPYWTSTTYAGNPATAWTVDARTGVAAAAPKDKAHFVRAVRTAH